MIKREIAPGILVYSDAIDGYETLINDIEEGVKSARILWHSAEIISGEDKKIRDTDSFSVEYIDHIVEEDPFGYLDAFNKNLSNIFYSGFNKYEIDYKNVYGITFSNHQNYEVLRYGNGQMFKNHIDDHEAFHRRISTVYYLNDNYEGGEINFPRFNISYKPKANEFLIFPSTYVYNHSISEVTNGTRYAVVSWIK